jgi:uroporphyrinogen-III synthase
VDVNRVLVTRSAEDGTALSQTLASEGFEVVRVPLIVRRYIEQPLAGVAHRVHDLWVLTSVGAVRALRATGAVPRKVAAVGQVTARAAREAGWSVDVVPTLQTGEGLVRALGDLTGTRVLYPKSDLAPPTVGDALRRAGAVVDEVVAYQNVEPSGVREALLAEWPVDAVVLTSGSAAQRLVEHLPPPWPDGVRVVAIGPSTARVLEGLGVVVHGIASTPDPSGVVDALKETPRLRTP